MSDSINQTKRVYNETQGQNTLILFFMPNFTNNDYTLSNFNEYLNNIFNALTFICLKCDDITETAGRAL